MASQGPRYPGTTSTLSNAGTSENANDWLTPGNITADDAAEAQITAATYDSPDISFILIGFNFGFTIPAGATIDGITVEIDRRSIIASSGKDFRVQLATGTNFADLVGTNKAVPATIWPTSLTIATYGGAADTWSASLTQAQVNAAGFAVFLSAQANIANADIGVDFIRVTINYTESANKTGTVVATGGGVATSAISGQHNGSPVATGGGVVASVRQKGANGTAALTGGGVAVAGFSGDHNAILLATGGGVVIWAYDAGGGPPALTGSFAATGGGVLLSVREKGGLRSQLLTGGGVYSQSILAARLGAALLTGGGVLVFVSQAGQTEAEQITGGGIVNWSEFTSRLVTVNLTGGGVAILTGSQPLAFTDLGQVMEAIATKIKDADITERAYGYPSETIDPPCVVVGYPPEIEFDLTFMRGADRCSIPVYFIVGRAVERSARDKLASIITGATGIKDTLDGNLNGTVQTARVTEMRIMNVQVSGIDYLAAKFEVEAIK